MSPTVPVYGQPLLITFTPVPVLGYAYASDAARCSLSIQQIVLKPQGDFRPFTESLIVPYQWQPQIQLSTPFTYKIPQSAAQQTANASQTIVLSPVTGTNVLSAALPSPCDSDRPADVQLLVPNLEVDSDGDGLSDLYEINVSHTDPNNAYSSTNGLPDGWQVMHGLNPLDPGEATNDPDHDGLNNLQEYLHGTDPHNPDTDGDGISDGDEVNLYHTDPTRADTVGDGISDGWKVFHGLNPLAPQSMSLITNNAATTVWAGMTYWDLWLTGAQSNTVIRHFYVPTQAASNNFTSIQAAINAATNAGSLYIIHVAAGTYNENLTITNQHSLMILGTNASSTIVSGTATNQPVISATGFTSLNIRGLTIRDGHAYNGAGIMANAPNGTLRVSNCIITNNTAQALGGGIYCVVTSNEDVASLVAPTVRDEQCIGPASLLVQTPPGPCGGSLGAQSALGWVIPSDQPCSNRYQYAVHGSTLPSSAIFNCIIADNSASDGGAVWVQSGGMGLLHDTIVTNHVLSIVGSGVYATPGSTAAAIINSILWKNGGQDVHYVPTSYSIGSSNQVLDGIGNLAADPQFVSEFLHNYHIHPASPARGAAWQSEIADDIDRETRGACTNASNSAITGLCDDIGADHYLDSSNDGIADSWKQQYGVTDPNADPDQDGLSNLQEFMLGTDPNNPDTDGDGYNDGQEVFFATNPLDPNSHPSIPANLVAWWTFGDGGGTNAADASGNGQTGQVALTNAVANASAWLTNGVEGGGLAFDGTGSNWVEIAGGGSFNSITTGLTVSAWVQMPTNAALGMVVSNGSFQLEAGQGEVEFKAFVSNQNVLVTGAITNDSLWHLITGTFNGAALSLYVDGSLLASQAATGTIDYVNAPIMVGIGANTNSLPFNGAIDDLQIYNRPLAPGEVMGIYNAQNNGYGVSDVAEANNLLANPYAPYLPQLIGWWGFDETNGLTATNSSAFGANGTMLNMGPSNRVLGYVRKGLLFNGTNTAVEIPLSQFPTLSSASNEISVAAWVNLNANGLNSTGTIFSLGSVSNGVEPEAGLVLALTNGYPVLSVFLAAGSATPFVLSAANPLPTNEWHHVIGVYSASRQTMVLYVDGAQAAINDSLGQAGSLLDGGDSYIGAVATNASNGLMAVFSGVLDEVRLYNTALSGQTAAQLAQSSPMVGWWTFDETNGPTAFDSSGQGDDGTLVGMTQSNRVPGYIANGLLFDGTGTAVDVPNPATSPLSMVANEFTIAAWVNLASNGLAGTETIFSLGSTNLGQPQVGGILALTNGYPTLTVFLSSAPTAPLILTSTNAIPTNEWHHVLGVYSASGSNMTLYVDGAQTAATNGLPQPGPALNGGDCYIGALATNGLQQIFSGVLDDVRLYRVSLSATTVSNLFYMQQQVQQIIQTQQVQQASQQQIMQTEMTLQAPNVTGESQAAAASSFSSAPWIAQSTNVVQDSETQFLVDTNLTSGTLYIPPNASAPFTPHIHCVF